MNEEKIKIMNDMKFRQACEKYVLDWNIGNFTIYKDVILLQTQVDCLYVLMDRNYNTIDVDELDYDLDTEAEFVDRKYYGYCNFTDILPNGGNLGYPFEEFTLKQIIDISNRIEVGETNQGHSLRIKVNGDWYDRTTIENEDYFKLLSYIKFLGEEIKQYFLLSYHMQAMGFEIPDVYAYVRTLNDKLLEFVFNCASLSRRPFPADYLNYIGQNIKNIGIEGINGLLFAAIDILLTEEGYKIDAKDYTKVERIPNREKPDYEELAKQLLKILDVSLEEVKQREENDRAISLEKKLAEFEPWAEEDIEE